MSTNNNNIIIAGNSGHAFVVIESLLSMNLSVGGYLDKIEVQWNPYHLKYMGFEGDENLNLHSHSIVMGIGDNSIRKRAFEKIITHFIPNQSKENPTAELQSIINKNELTQFLEKFINVIDPTSNISKTAEIGIANFVSKGCQINSFSKIGSNCILNTSSVIEHECKIGNHSHIAPGTVLLGNVIIGDSTLIGANSTVLPGIKIGSNCIVGAGSVVTKNMPDGAKWIGNKQV